MEILRVYAHIYVETGHYLDISIGELNKADIWQDGTHRASLLGVLERLGTMCVEGDLPVTRVLVDHILLGMREGETSPEMRAVMDNVLLQQNLHELRNRFTDELKTKLFLIIATAKQTHFDSPRLGWEKIVARFPNCLNDVEEMNKCFALSRYTATMFHALQVAEWGAVELGKRIGVIDHKVGWVATSKHLGALVDAGYAKLPSTISLPFSFLEQMNREIETMMLAWRHKVDHAANRLIILPNTTLTPDIAEHIIKSVKVFMGRLEEGLPK